MGVKPREAVARPLREIERGLTLAVLAATVVVLVLVAKSHLLPEQRPLTFGLVFWKWLILFYGAIALPITVALGIAVRHPSRVAARTVQILWIAIVVGFLGLVATNRGGLRTLASLDGPDQYRWMTQAGFLLAILGLAATVLAPPVPRWLARLLAAAGVAVPAIALLPQSPWQATMVETEAIVAASSTPRPEMRFLLIGIDAADWHYMDPLIARGELPNLAALACHGAYGPLQTIQPTLSPVVWTSIATGVPPGRHGVRDFFADRLAGVGGPLPHIKPPRSVGFEWLEARLKAAQIIASTPVGSDTRAVPAYWNIASLLQRPVVVVNWWATWPAEPIDGAMVSDRIFFDRVVQHGGPPSSPDLTSPAALFDEVAPLVVLPPDLPIETARAYVDVTEEEFARMRRRDETLSPQLRELNHFVAAFESTHHIALHTLDHHPDADALILFRIVDKMCHAALTQSELVDDHVDASPESVARYGRMVSAAYRAVDRAVGELVDSFGEGNVIIVSDHGFDLETMPRPPYRHYHHDAAPDGVFVAAGPAIRPGRFEGLTIYDIMPLLLHLRGMPTAEDQVGRLPRSILAPTFLARRPETRIESYGRLQARPLARGEVATDAEVLQELQELGYIRVDADDVREQHRSAPQHAPRDATRPEAASPGVCPSGYR